MQADRACSDGKRRKVWEVRSVNYDADGMPDGFTPRATEPSGRTMDELRRELTRMLASTYEPRLMAMDVARKA